MRIEDNVYEKIKEYNEIKEELNRLYEELYEYNISSYDKLKIILGR